MNDIKLTDHFWLREFIKSDTAERLGIDNTPPSFAINNLSDLCENVLEPVRLHFNKPVVVRSGYRCKKLNSKIGSKPTSQHVEGKAADFEIVDVPNLELANWIKYNIDFDQLILEFYYAGEPNSGWVHCSYNGIKNRGSILTINNTGVYKGLLS